MEPYIFWWSIFGVAGACTGLFKGRVLSGIILGLLLGPIGWIIILFSPGKQPCPACNKRIPQDTTSCPYCHSPVDPPIAKNRRLSTFGRLVSFILVFCALAGMGYFSRADRPHPGVHFQQIEDALTHPSATAKNHQRTLQIHSGP